MLSIKSPPFSWADWISFGCWKLIPGVFDMWLICTSTPTGTDESVCIWRHMPNLNILYLKLFTISNGNAHSLMCVFVKGVMRCEVLCLSVCLCTFWGVINPKFDFSTFFLYVCFMAGNKYMGDLLLKIVNMGSHIVICECWFI